MKILYHHRTASKDGQAVHIDEMIGALRTLGHEVLVVAPSVAAEGRMGAKVGWVHRLKERLPKVVYELLELGYSFLAYRRLWQAARGFRPDVIYERYNLYLLAGVMLKRRLGLPLLLEVNAPLADERDASGGLGLPRLARWAERTAWRGADRVLPVTHVLGHMLQTQAGVAPERIVVIANGINQEHFASAPVVTEAKAALGWRDDLVLGFTGFVREWHGVDRVIRWLADPSTPTHARLLVVGDGPARPALEALAREIGVATRVTFTGFVSRTRVPEWVAAFDIALQPAVTAYASPLKLFEYLALGKAIVAPRMPNIMEVLRDGENALLFDAGNERGLAEALTRLGHDRTLRERLAARARATIDELDLTWRGNAQRVASLAHALCGTTPSCASRAPAAEYGSAEMP